MRQKAQELLCNSFGYWGRLDIPYVSFGNVDSLDLFCSKELEVMALYWENRNRWGRSLDIGANIGLHTILMAKLGWYVRAFEPDPKHFTLLIGNLIRNGVMDDEDGVEAYEKAVSDHDGFEMFVRVCGNTTGSHLSGDKQPYGVLEKMQVQVTDCHRLWSDCDFAKLDCEGHEARLLLTVTPEQARTTDFLVEVGNKKNAELILLHFAKLPTRLWSQKTGWSIVKGMADMPIHHSEGALFIGREPPFPKP